VRAERPSQSKATSERCLLHHQLIRFEIQQRLSSDKTPAAAAKGLSWTSRTSPLVPVAVASVEPSGAHSCTPYGSGDANPKKSRLRVRYRLCPTASATRGWIFALESTQRLQNGEQLLHRSLSIGVRTRSSITIVNAVIRGTLKTFDTLIES
jgi:hypothetical protein